MSDIYRLLIYAGILAVQYYLSTRNNIYWGIIIPVAFPIVLTWMFVTNLIEHPFGFSVMLLVGMLSLLAQWGSGRNTLQKRRKKELAKMKSHDMK